MSGMKAVPLAGGGIPASFVTVVAAWSVSHQLEVGKSRRPDRVTRGACNPGYSEQRALRPCSIAVAHATCNASICVPWTSDEAASQAIVRPQDGAFRSCGTMT